MRRTKYTSSTGSRKKNVLLIFAGISLLIVIFFLSFVIAYNVMSKDKGKNVDQSVISSELDGLSKNGGEELPTDVQELQKKIEAQNEYIAELEAQIEKYKALAEVKSGAIPNATTSPSVSASPSSSRTPSPSQSPVPSPSATPK